MRIKAIFIPDASVVMKDRVTERGSVSLLKHEQGHFDLAEEVARLANLTLDNQFRDRKFTVKGKTHEEAQKNVIGEASVITSEILERLHNDLRAQERQYDKETNYGRNMEKQEEYNKRFDNLRKE